MRKSLAQIAKEDRVRTEKWRAERTARKVPESRQVDKAVLTAFLQRGRQGPVFMIDEAALAEIFHLSVRLLVSWRCDQAESVKAMKKRVAELMDRRQMEALATRESWAETDRLRDAEGVTA
ncbi:hypothetical protein D3218_19115 [Aureimonas flava]|uniref:Uncharacterized protein n=1 Tax=Aureimonas flava TaxID=2320271 RepID=A0A3A1WHC5_9HYPH|nr:hypothetical protein [Aureimonas flava]RIX97172.1 hypothetical protein D3218_19115 [Aureimonas flava]